MIVEGPTAGVVEAGLETHPCVRLHRPVDDDQEAPQGTVHPDRLGLEPGPSFRPGTQTQPGARRDLVEDGRRRGVDNVLKSVLDGMNGVAYHDDSQVQWAKVTKWIDREHPRTEVVVRRAEA